MRSQIFTRVGFAKVETNQSAAVFVEFDVISAERSAVGIVHDFLQPIGTAVGDGRLHPDKQISFR